MIQPIEIKHIEEGIIIENMDKCTISAIATRWPWFIQKLISITKGETEKEGAYLLLLYL
jgi:hypothetical protein